MSQLVNYKCVIRYMLYRTLNTRMTCATATVHRLKVKYEVKYAERISGFFFCMCVLTSYIFSVVPRQSSRL